MKNPNTRNYPSSYRYLGLLIILAFSLFWGMLVTHAQTIDDSEPQVQELSGLIDPGTIAVYRLLNLKEDQRLYVRMENTTGNLCLLYTSPSPRD